MKATHGNILLSMTAAVLMMAPPVQAGRVFTSNDGKTIEAEIAAATETEVTLKKKNDVREYKVPLERLSKEDREFVLAWLEKEKSNRRPAREIKLETEEGQTKTMKVPEGVYLSGDGVLTLYPGDEVHLEFEEEKGKLENPRVVAKVTAPERTISFSMQQDAKTTFLARSTEIQKTVVMDCEHRTLGNDRFFRTNLFPTEKGLMAGDSWPNNVWTLRLKNVAVTDKSASEAYAEKRKR